MLSRRKQVRFLAAVFFLTVGSAAAEPLFTLSEDGKTFLYRARPGDHPGVVAEMFGIPARDLPAFLAANGISDSTKVAAGFEYRIPNAAARALAERAAALEADNARLKRAAGDEKAASERLAHAAEDARAEKALAESRATRLAGLERLWPWAKAALTLLLAAAAGAFYTAVAALRRRTEAEGYARSLANDLEEKRKTTLAERQESARHISTSSNASAPSRPSSAPGQSWAAGAGA